MYSERYDTERGQLNKIYCIFFNKTPTLHVLHFFYVVKDLRFKKKKNKEESWCSFCKANCIIYIFIYIKNYHHKHFYNVEFLVSAI